jgi:hypothetical protein
VTPGTVTDTRDYETCLIECIRHSLRKGIDMARRQRVRRLRIRGGILAGGLAALVGILPASPASAATSPVYSGTLAVAGGAASYRAGFRVIGPMTQGALAMTVRDTVADGYCIHGSVTYNISNWPDPTYDSPNVCGSGTYRSWTSNNTRYLPLAVNGMLVKVCKTIANAPDPCTTRYIDNPLR